MRGDVPFIVLRSGKLTQLFAHRDFLKIRKDGGALPKFLRKRCFGKKRNANVLSSLLSNSKRLAN